MKLRSLEAFCAAVEERSISGAARRMYLSQPSVSERLAELEREARVPLLERSRRGVKTTDQGALFYEHARKVLDEMRALENVVGTLRSRRDSKLYVAASSTLGEHLFPTWLWSFARETPDIAPELFVGNTREVVALVSRGVVAFGIIEGREERGTLSSVPFLDDELVVVVAPGHRWAKGSLTPAELPEEPFISREKGSGTREVVERAAAKMGIVLDTRMELGSTSAIKEAIEAGLGFSILSRETIRLEVESGHLTVAKGINIPRRFRLIHDPATVLTPLEESFRDYLLEMGRRSAATRKTAEHPQRHAARHRKASPDFP